MRLLSDQQLEALRPAETAAFAGPIPTQIVSSDEYFPLPQSALQRRVELLTRALGDAESKRQGMSRRRTRPLFDVSAAEASDKELANERAKGARRMLSHAIFTPGYPAG